MDHPSKLRGDAGPSRLRWMTGRRWARRQGAVPIAAYPSPTRCFRDQHLILIRSIGFLHTEVYHRNQVARRQPFRRVIGFGPACHLVTPVVDETETEPFFMQEQQRKQVMSGIGQKWLVFEFVLERLDDTDLLQCALTCHEWHLMVKRERQARNGRDATRWTSQRVEWEKQHAKWKITRAQLSERDAQDLDRELYNVFDVSQRDIPVEHVEPALLLERVEELYERGAGTFAFEPHESSWNLATMAERWVCEQTSYAFSEDRLTPAHVVRRLIGMGPAMKTNRVYTGPPGGISFPTMVLESLVTGQSHHFSPIYDSIRLTAIFDFLLEPMAMVSTDFALDCSVLAEPFDLFETFLRPRNGSMRKRVIDLLMCSGFAQQWPRRSGDGEIQSTADDFWWGPWPRLAFARRSPEFWEFVMDHRSSGLRAQLLHDILSGCTDRDMPNLAKKEIFSSPQKRKLFVDLLKREDSLRCFVINRFPGAMFELARMRERRILRLFLELERGRLLELRDDQENCLLLHVAGCRGCISGVVCDLLAAGFDPHRRNVHRQTACDRYKGTRRALCKQEICILNFGKCSDVRRGARCDRRFSHAGSNMLVFRNGGESLRIETL